MNSCLLCLFSVLEAKYFIAFLVACRVEHHFTVPHSTTTNRSHSSSLNMGLMSTVRMTMYAVMLTLVAWMPAALCPMYSHLSRCCEYMCESNLARFAGCCKAGEPTMYDVTCSTSCSLLLAAYCMPLLYDNLTSCLKSRQHSCDACFRIVRVFMRSASR